MKTPAAVLLSLVILASAAPPDLRVWRDDQGRKLVAELIETGDGWIKVKRADGNKFTLTLDKLSPEDRAWVKEREAQLKKDALAATRAVEVPAKILAYCKAQSGKQVGNGECWTLADECFKSCGLQRPKGQMRAWGRKIDFPKEQPQPGDIVEYRSASFSNGSRTGPEHTAIVIGRGKKKGVVMIAEQNWGGVKKVHECEMDPGALVSGEIMFYRPE